MEIAEITEWNQLVGKTIRVKLNDGRVNAIGHIIKNDWFYPEEDFKSIK